MNKREVVQAILGSRIHHAPTIETTVFAPTNIALCKYWGKRDQELNLPVTSSLSISLDDKGAYTTFSVIEKEEDEIILNDAPVLLSSSFAKRLINFLNLFRNKERFKIILKSTIPIAAGLASSAAGFASIVKGLDALYDWKLSLTELSLLARLGSGSACRSLWSGFVLWNKGEREDGMDSYAELFHPHWEKLRVKILMVSESEKSLSSREAMQRTIETSKLYSKWPNKVQDDLEKIKHAILTNDFKLLGETAESNALFMHETMKNAHPPIEYSSEKTYALMQRVWDLRNQGVSIYFTQDAGPNLKLLYLDN